MGHDYTIQEFSLESGDSNGGYALAWNIAAAPVPVPAVAWLMGSAVLGLLSLLRRRQLTDLVEPHMIGLITSDLWALGVTIGKLVPSLVSPHATP